MLSHGMTIDPPSAELAQALRLAAADTVASWVRQAGPERAAPLRH